MKTALNSQLIGSHMNKVKQNRNLITDALAHDFIVISNRAMKIAIIKSKLIVS